MRLKLKKGLVVSCQAQPNEPMYGAQYMAKMALAAQIGGAIGVRVNTIVDIVACKKEVTIPVVGLIKNPYEGYFPYITPTLKEVKEVIEAGADVVAIDATRYERPDGMNVSDFIRLIKNTYDVEIMADVSTVEEGVVASNAGADYIATTLSGYTPDTIKTDSDIIIELQDPDYELIADLSKVVSKPIIAEGRFWDGNNAELALLKGAYAVTIGAGITRPQIITKKIVDQINALTEEQV